MNVHFIHYLYDNRLHPEMADIIKPETVLLLEERAALSTKELKKKLRTY